MPIREALLKRASRAGLSLSKETVDALAEYFQLLQKWNRKVSLTALPVDTAGDEAIDRLLIEPILASRYLPQPDAVILDIGSGGGSPAIPIRIAAPGIALRMVESKRRKAAFLREVIRTMRLDGTQVEALRFEELLAQPSLREAFDVATLRAVRVDRKALISLEAFLKPDGRIFLFGTAGPPPDLMNSGFSLLAQHPLLNQWGSVLTILCKSN